MRPNELLQRQSRANGSGSLAMLAFTLAIIVVISTSMIASVIWAILMLSGIFLFWRQAKLEKENRTAIEENLENFLTYSRSANTMLQMTADHFLRLELFLFAGLILMVALAFFTPDMIMYSVFDSSLFIGLIIYCHKNRKKCLSLINHAIDDSEPSFERVSALRPSESQPSLDTQALLRAIESDDLDHSEAPHTSESHPSSLSTNSLP